MFADVDFSSWVAGWTALGFVTAYGIIIIWLSVATHRARDAIQYRILVTGSRGKSGTVRLVAAALAADRSTYAKITGTAAREIFPDGTEVETRRIGATSTSELAHSLRRAAKAGADTGVFECMAITPSLIRMVQRTHVQAQMVIIPAIRLDHLEEEGLSELAIGRNIINAIDGCEVIVTGVDQPEVLEYFRTYCAEHDIRLVEVQSGPETPVVPGHHPTNVAIALRVAEELGQDRDISLAAIRAASLEPRAESLQRLSLEDGFTIDVVDLSGANDPQSAWDAIRAIGFDHAPVVPVLVNRWERPLRTVSFFASFRGAYPVFGVMGTLSRWMATRHRLESYRLSRDHQESQYFRFTRQMAENPELLAKTIRGLVDTPDNRVIFLLLENTHDATADRFRALLDRLATEETVGQEVNGT